MMPRRNYPITRKQGRWASTVQQRVDWLLAYPNFWKDWCARDSRTRALVDLMRDAGLVSKTTYWKDIRMDSLILLAQRESNK